MIRIPSHRDLYDIGTWLEDLRVNQVTVLDLGCGDYTSIFGRQLRSFPFKKLIGVDAWFEDLEKCLSIRFAAHDVVFRHANIFEVLKGMTSQEERVDVSLLLDVVEHQSPEEVLELFSLVDAVTTTRAVVFSPIEPVGWHRDHRVSDPTQGRENPYQEHKSWLVPEILESRGYRTVVMKDFHFQAELAHDAFWAIKEYRSDTATRRSTSI